MWPLVALLSFTVIPLEKRTLFGSTVGLYAPSILCGWVAADRLQVLGYLHEYVGFAIIG